MAEEEKPGAGAEPTPLQEIIDQKVIADYTDSQDREEVHTQVREARAEPKPKKAKTEQQPKPEPGYVPLREVLDERERRQKAEAEAQRYRSAHEDNQRKLAAEAANDPAPDKFKDPALYDKWVERQMDRRAQAIADKQIGPMRQQMREQTLGMSELRAKAALGPEKFKPFEEWLFKQPDELKDRFEQSDDPYAAAYQHYRASTTFERLGADDLDTYEKKLRDKWEAEQKLKLNGRTDPYAQTPEPDDDEPDPQPKPAPRSFAASRSQQPRDDGGKYAGPKPLGELVREKDQRPKR